MPHKKAGVITAAHALRGHVKIKSFLEDHLSLHHYSPITISDKLYHLSDVKIQSKVIVAKFHEINSREQAEALIGSSLYIDADKLPELIDDEYYPDDLINLSVLLTDNSHYGTITNVYNFGAGDIIEIAIDKSKKTILLPFDHLCFPSIDLKKAEATLVLPDNV